MTPIDWYLLGLFTLPALAVLVIALGGIWFWITAWFETGYTWKDDFRARFVRYERITNRYDDSRHRHGFIFNTPWMGKDRCTLVRRPWKPDFRLKRKKTIVVNMEDNRSKA